MGKTARWTSAILVLFLAAFALGVASISVSADTAWAQKNATDEGYGNELMGGKEQPWNETVLTDTTKVQVSKDVNKSISQKFVDASGPIAGILVLVALVLAVGRLVGRGICEMTMRQTAGGMKGIPKIFLTGDERNTGSANRDWFLPMAKETGIYLGLTLFVFVILGVLAGLVLFAIDQFIATGSQSTGQDIGKFEFGDATVTTTTK